MKKKILLSLLVLCCTFCLVGCNSSNETVDNLLTALQEEQIVDKDLELIDEVVGVNVGTTISRTTYYIYKNQNSELIAINYDTNIYSKYDFDYSITIYSKVSINNDIEYLDDDKIPEHYYIYQNDEKSEYNKYNLENQTIYLISESKPLFSKTKYTIEKSN